MRYLTVPEVLEFSRNGAYLAAEHDGRVFLCSTQGRDLGRVEPRLFELLAATGRLHSFRIGGIRALRYIDSDRR